MAIIKTNAVAKEDFGLKHVITLEGSQYYRIVDGQDMPISEEEYKQIIFRLIERGQEINSQVSVF
jgi:hypothetical protein